MTDNQEKLTRLSEYIQGLMNNEDRIPLYERYKADFENVTPQEIFGAFYILLEKGVEPKEILVVLGKVINVFYEALTAYQWKRPEHDSFLDYLMRENLALTEKLEGIKGIMGDKELQGNAKREQLLPRIQELLEFNPHYLKKENILFPYLEKKMDRFDGLAIMWSLHDTTRTQIKKVIQCLESEVSTDAEMNAEMGSLIFALYGLIRKEELILFPAASEVISQREWEEMQRQSLEYEFPFIQGPQHQSETIQGTGQLNFDEISMIFNALPVDLTFVDENNKVKYFTRPKDRIFPRSPAIIGRDVDKCHPPESVHVVHKIIESFRDGSRDTAKFWINVKGKTILIQYFALRDEKGKYKGVLEASQDVTDIKTLEGERRLLL